MDPKYDVCFSGEILPDQNAEAVKLRLAKLFKANEATLTKLFSGKIQLLKRSCDRETALKYKKAMEQSGAKAIIRTSTVAAASQSEPALEPEAKTQKKPALTAAQRIAMLAEASDVATSSATTGDDAPSDQETVETSSEGRFKLSPVGADMLEPGERASPPEVQIDTSQLELADSEEHLTSPLPQEELAPDISHLSMGEVGEDIPTLAREETPISPDTSAISLSEPDGDFSDCAPPPAPEPDLDLSELELAASGADMLDAAYKKKVDATAPVTDHIELKD